MPGAIFGLIQGSICLDLRWQRNFFTRLPLSAEAFIEWVLIDGLDRHRRTLPTSRIGLQKDYIKPIPHWLSCLKLDRVTGPGRAIADGSIAYGFPGTKAQSAGTRGPAETAAQITKGYCKNAFLFFNVYPAATQTSRSLP